MRDIVSCFSESSVIVSQSACTSYSSNACVSPALTPSVRNAATSLYRTVLSSQKQLFITVTWLRTHAAQSLTIDFGPGGGSGPDDSPPSFKLNTSSRLLRKKKGSRQLELPSPSGPRIEVFWDLSNARFDAGPEPTDNFYVVAVIDSEIGLILGDVSEEAALKRFKPGTAEGKFRLISRREHCSGNTVYYSTRARFGPGGPVHDIVVRFVGENEQLKHPALLVYVDRKVVMQAKRLMWNFRGNQTIFIDGLLVDLMWDLHNWFFSSVSGSAVFMFRTRSGLDSRLWLEEKLLPSKDEANDKAEFSLLICASKEMK